MPGGFPSLKDSAGLRSRRSMLETLVRHLDMVRLTLGTSIVALAMGCTGLIDVGEATKAETARKKWVEAALPALTAGTCANCHGGSRVGVDFLLGTDDLGKRDRVLAFEPPAVNLDAPQSSRLVTKGAHEGPALAADAREAVISWITAEKEAQFEDPDNPPTPQLATEPYTILLCTGGLPGTPTCPLNEILLDRLTNGEGIPGAKITFVAQGVGSGLYFNNLKLVPGAMGAYIEHPLFSSISDDPQEEPIADTFDRFFNVKMNLMASATPEEQQIAGGTAAFVNFQPARKVVIFFKGAKTFQADTPVDPGGQTGCKVPGTFETAARVPLNNNCGSCHRGQNGNATSALDMTGIDQPNAMNACNQIRLRVAFNNIDTSGIFVATAPGNANHPFNFNNNAAAHTAFKNALNPWIIAERDAP